MVKVLIVDQFSLDSIEQIKSEGVEVVYDPTLKDQKLTDELQRIQPEILLVRSSKVQVAQLDAGLPNLKIVIRAGSGFDTIDFKYAKEKGIAVCNTPGMNATAVAELVFAHILQFDRRLSENIELFKNGKWNKGSFSKCGGLKGRTIGIIGFGKFFFFFFCFFYHFLLFILIFLVLESLCHSEHQRLKCLLL
jgi:D-3-phosphoglycerate dehydrogenase